MIDWNIKEWFCKNVKFLLFCLEYSSQLDVFLCCLWRPSIIRTFNHSVWQITILLPWRTLCWPVCVWGWHSDIMSKGYWQGDPVMECIWMWGSDGCLMAPDHWVAARIQMDILLGLVWRSRAGPLYSAGEYCGMQPVSVLGIPDGRWIVSKPFKYIHTQYFSNDYILWWKMSDSLL